MSSADDRTARPGPSAWKTARAGAFPGYPPLALTRRRAVPLAAGTCQPNAPCGLSVTVTVCPVDTRTVAPLSAAVRELVLAGVADAGTLVGTGDAGTLADPAGEALPVVPPPDPGAVAVPQADSTSTPATSAARVTGLLMPDWTPGRVSRFHRPAVRWRSCRTGVSRIGR